MVVALYARLATIRQNEPELAILDQMRQLRDYCKAHGHVLAKEYIDAGFSGMNDNRPEFRRMISDATAEPSLFEAIIVLDHSRFFRNMNELLNYERILNKKGCKLISIMDQKIDNQPVMISQFF
jgi:DNA invertase Pin-like site-specific DNA recombinase